MDEYRLQGRGGKGIITMRVTDRIGQVVGVRMVHDDDDVMLITDSGKVIRTPVSGISIIGRNTQGVRLIELDEGEKVVAVASLAEKVPSGENGGEPEAGGEGPASPES
jgi:DNA gyrase subunit A